MTVHRLLHEQRAVRIEFPDEAPGAGIEARVTRVEEHRLWIEAADGALRPSVGARVLVRCWDPFGVYSALTRITEVSSPSRFAIEASTLFEAEEHRRFYRVGVQIPFAFSRLDGADASAISQPVHSSTVDVSPGGLKFCTTLPIAVGDRLALRLTYLTHALELEGRVVRTDAGPDGDARAVSVEFQNIDDVTQVQITRLIFAEQHRSREPV